MVLLTRQRPCAHSQAAAARRRGRCRRPRTRSRPERPSVRFQGRVAPRSRAPRHWNADPRCKVWKRSWETSLIRQYDAELEHEKEEAEVDRRAIGEPEGRTPRDPGDELRSPPGSGRPGWAGSAPPRRRILRLPTRTGRATRAPGLGDRIGCGHDRRRLGDRQRHGIVAASPQERCTLARPDGGVAQLVRAGVLYTPRRRSSNPSLPYHLVACEADISTR